MASAIGEKRKQRTGRQIELGKFALALLSEQMRVKSAEVTISANAPALAIKGPKLRTFQNIIVTGPKFLWHKS
jgi:hypothetical protein